ncbi:MAG: HAD-IA family hydrolase [Pseudomonadota bacterium]
MSQRVIAWDFDGVLNRNIVDGRLIWKTNFSNDLGVSEDEFSNYMFRSGRFDDVLIGRRDVRDLVSDWLSQSTCQHSVDQILDYWFSNDALPDERTLEILNHASANGFQNVLATNNETRRVAYIENDMGFANKVDHVFAAGRMGCKKPDPAFFENIEHTLQVAAEEILLIDDKAANVEAAKALGWSAFHFRGGDYAGLSRAISEHGVRSPKC